MYRIIDTKTGKAIMRCNRATANRVLRSLNLSAGWLRYDAVKIGGAT